MLDAEDIMHNLIDDEDDAKIDATKVMIKLNVGTRRPTDKESTGTGLAETLGFSVFCVCSL